MVVPKKMTKGFSFERLFVQKARIFLGTLEKQIHLDLVPSRSRNVKAMKSYRTRNVLIFWSLIFFSSVNGIKLILDLFIECVFALILRLPMSGQKEMYLQNLTTHGL